MSARGGGVIESVLYCNTIVCLPRLFGLEENAGIYYRKGGRQERLGNSAQLNKLATLLLNNE